MSSGLAFSLSEFNSSVSIEKKLENFECAGAGCKNNLSARIAADRISESEICLSGRVSGWLELECARCLEKYKEKTEFTIETEMSFIDGKIDAMKEIRQSLILEMPSKPICFEGCLGICRYCGRKNTIQDSCKCSVNDNCLKERWEELFRNNRRK
jgi:uncharacterized protein